MDSLLSFLVFHLLYTAAIEKKNKSILSVYMRNFYMVGEKYWKISRVVMVVTSDDHKHRE